MSLLLKFAGMVEASGLRNDGGSPNGKKALTVLVCLVVVLVALSAPVLAVTPTDGNSQDSDADASLAADLSCIDDVSGNLQSIAEKTMEALPASVRDQAAEERILISIEGSTYFSAVVNEQQEVTRVKERKIDDPTYRVQTDCNTIDRIVSSDSPSRELERSISRGDIVWEGVGTARDAAVSYGSKAVQMKYIVSSSDTGNVENGVDGFRKGLLFG